MKKFRLVTLCTCSKTERYHEIEGKYKTEAEALEAFGGKWAAWEQAIDDHVPSFYIKEMEADDE